MLEVKHLSYTVTENQETLPIVADISFTVNDGEMLVITGPNGGGKSTLARRNIWTGRWTPRCPAEKEKEWKLPR